MRFFGPSMSLFYASLADFILGPYFLGSCSCVYLWMKRRNARSLRFSISRSVRVMWLQWLFNSEILSSCIGVKIFTSNKKFFAMTINYTANICFHIMLLFLKLNLIAKIKTFGPKKSGAPKIFGPLGPLVNAALPVYNILQQYISSLSLMLQ